MTLAAHALRSSVAALDVTAVMIELLGAVVVALRITHAQATTLLVSEEINNQNSCIFLIARK